ncbi:MAG: hypothetical protein ABGY41_11740 [Candidatus Poribacteria bacterium]
MSTTTHAYLARAAYTKEGVDRFLDSTAHNWGAFDPELGYVRQASIQRNGVDGSFSVRRDGPHGERLMQNYAAGPCRVNTYGNSFTQCDQVSDGETWQEYLAAHIGEPVRNFGVGGYGVYQAYRRMLREEATIASAEYVMLNVWSDDHYRSIYSWRMLHMPGYAEMLRDTLSVQDAGHMFHANPWAHLRMNLDTGAFEEQPNRYPTPDSLYDLCDLDHVVEAFRNDVEVQCRLATQGATDVQVDLLTRFADALDMPADFSSPDAAAKTGGALLTAYALRSTMFVVDRAEEFAASSGKKLMVLLSFMSSDIVGACHERPRFDQPFVDYLNGRDVLYVDSLQKHVDDFAQFACTPEEYAARYYIGHYAPVGNHFFAFAIKDEVVGWLNPTPPAYRFDTPPRPGALV